MKNAQRRSSGLLSFLAVFALCLPVACSAETEAQAPQHDYKLNVHYKAVRKAQPALPEGKQVVSEIFWYGCGHCFSFDPVIKKWEESKPAGVEFVRIPASLGRPEGLMHSRMFYTAQVLGKENEMHEQIFNRIHNLKQGLSSKGEIQRLFEAFGVDKKTFEQTFNGFAVDNLVRRAEQKIREIGISSVPTVVVNDKYWTNGRYAGGFQQMMDVVDGLLADAK